jgi:hypothetical protein
MDLSALLHVSNSEKNGFDGRNPLPAEDKKPVVNSKPNGNFHRFFFGKIFRQ